MYKSIFMGLTIGIIAALLLVVNPGIIYGQGSGMQIFVSPQDEDRDDDDPKDKVREIIDKVKDSDSSEEEGDVRDTIEKIKDRDDSKGDGDSGGEGVGVSPEDCRTVFRTSECGDIACTGPRCIALFD